MSRRKGDKITSNYPQPVRSERKAASSETSSSDNSRLALILVGIFLVLSAFLFLTAIRTNMWREFSVTLLHVALTTLVSYLLLKTSANT